MYTDKIPVPPPAKCSLNTDPDILKVKEFRDRIRNGLYHLGYTKKGLWIHNDSGKPDFEIVQEADLSKNGMIDVYRMNPHATTRTIIDHFPKFLADLRDPANGLQPRFLDFFDNYHKA